jgi:putative phosphoribosyl transferase
MIFADRADAGRRLAARLQHLRGERIVVLGLPRGGVPVAFEVARALGAPLDVIVVRKLGVPFQPELGMGAIGEDGARVINLDVVRRARVPGNELAAVEARERAELDRRVARYRTGRPRQPLDGRVAVVVDDGIATGSTARAACQIARAHGAARVVLAVPVAPPRWQDRAGGDADELVCVQNPEQFAAIGQFYADFSPTSDEEVIACLQRAAASSPEAASIAADDNGAAAADPPIRAEAADDPPTRDEEVEIHTGTAALGGRLAVPGHPIGIVVFASGSGSSRHSPRNRYLAHVLNQAALGTLLCDLLAPGEEMSPASVFDIGLLAGRLIAVTGWLRTRPDVTGLPVGYFGASTGGAAALWAAAEPGADIAAVVSCGGRPDLASARLGSVTAPTLLIAGGSDDAAPSLNRRAQTELRCENNLAVVPGATLLFQEPGTLTAAAALARDWFASHLHPSPRH